MNIFILDNNQKNAAIYHTDKHVIKQILESTQLLCSAHHLSNSCFKIPYKLSHHFHPTVKSLSLIKYLASLLKMPQNTLILDMFAGSGTLGVACEQLKIPYILIEKEEEYCDIIRARVAAANEPDRPAKRKKITKSTNTLIPWEEIDNGKNP
jgi:DNA modification methylase